MSLAARNDQLFMVSAGTKPRYLGGAIAKVLRQRGELELQAVGAAAVNQAVKGMCVACEYLRGEGIDAHFRPLFKEIGGPDSRNDLTIITAVRFLVEARPCPKENPSCSD
jgi:stage V sporulation protein S